MAVKYFFAVSKRDPQNRYMANPNLKRDCLVNIHEVQRSSFSIHTHAHMWSHVRTLLSPPLPPDSTSGLNPEQAQTISEASYSSPTWLSYTSHTQCQWITWAWETLTELLFVYHERRGKTSQKNTSEGVKRNQGHWGAQGWDPRQETASEVRLNSVCVPRPGSAPERPHCWTVLLGIIPPRESCTPQFGDSSCESSPGSLICTPHLPRESGALSHCPEAEAKHPASPLCRRPPCLLRSSLPAALVVSHHRWNHSRSRFEGLLICGPVWADTLPCDRDLQVLFPWVGAQK